MRRTRSPPPSLRLRRDDRGHDADDGAQQGEGGVEQVDEIALGVKPRR